MNSRPERYNLITLGGEFNLGLEGNIRQLYHSYLDTSQPGKIIGDTTREVEPEVVAMLKSILQAGCCRIEERSIACRTVFKQCLNASTKEDFINAFTPDTEDKFVQAIYKAVKKEWYA